MSNREHSGTRALKKQLRQTKIRLSLRLRVEPRCSWFRVLGIKMIKQQGNRMRRGRFVTIQSFAVLLLLASFMGISPALEELGDSSAMEMLARKLEGRLSDAGIKTVVVFDLSGPDGQSLPLGGWLADEVSRNLKHGTTQVHVIDRARILTELQAENLTTGSLVSPALRIRIAQALGADGFIGGSFGPFKEQVGITLAVWRLVEAKPTSDSQYVSMVTGKIPLGQEGKAYLAAPLESLRPVDGIYKAGYAGRGIAECSFCPPPRFSPAVVLKVNHGTVLAMIVVSAEGRVSEVKIVDSPDSDLNSAAIEAIETYKFKPALDPDGQAVPIRMPYSLTFHLKS
jgi:TonB family protein